MPASLQDLIEPMICLSTLHLTKDTCEGFNSFYDFVGGYPIHYPNEYGSFVCVASVNRGPPDLAEVLDWAKFNGIAWVKFDPDGSVIDTLPTYDETWS